MCPIQKPMLERVWNSNQLQLSQIQLQRFGDMSLSSLAMLLMSSGIFINPGLTSGGGGFSTVVELEAVGYL